MNLQSHLLRDDIPEDVKREIKLVIVDQRKTNLGVIFDQFVSIPTEFSATDTWIGLYLYRKTLEAHKGKITAQNKEPGHVATSIIELPGKKHWMLP